MVMFNYFNFKKINFKFAGLKNLLSHVFSFSFCHFFFFFNEQINKAGGKKLKNEDQEEAKKKKMFAKK